MKFSIKSFFSNCDHVADLVTFTKDMLNEKLYFLCSKMIQTESTPKLEE